MQTSQKLTSQELSSLLARNHTHICELWIKRIRKTLAAAGNKNKAFLEDHLGDVIERLVKVLANPEKCDDFFAAMKLAIRHGEQRAYSADFKVSDLVTEYRLLREIITEFAESDGRSLSIQTLSLLANFIEASLANATEEFLRNSVRELVEKQDLLRETIEANAKKEAAEFARAELYQLIMQAPMAMVLMLGQDHRFAVANPPYEELMGRPVLGKTVLEAFSEKEIHEFIPLLNHVLSSGQPYIGKEAPLTIKNRHGVEETHFVDFSYHPFRNLSGEIRGILAVVIDVTEQVVARQQIELEKQKFEAIFSEAPSALALLRGPEHIFERVNPSFVSLMAQRELIGKPLIEAIPELQGQAYPAVLDQVYRSGKSVHQTEAMVKMVKKSGGQPKTHYLDFSCISIKDAQGQPYGVYIHAIDTTERVLARKTLEENEKQIRTYAESLPHMAYIASPDGDILYQNRQFYDYIGASLEKVEGWDWKTNQIVHPDDLDRTAQAWSQAIREEAAYANEYRLRRHDGQYRWFLTKAVPYRDESGRILRWYGTNTDIHDQKKTQEQLEQAKMSAELANEAKSSFLANISHEIRTPLGAMMGFVELMAQPNTSEDERRYYLSVISRNSNQVLRIIDGLLDLAKVEAGKMEIETIQVSLVELLADFSSLMRLRAKEKSISFELKAETPFPDIICSDPTRIRQILTNVVGNAIKFTNKGHVTLSVSFRDQMLGFKVQDTGYGISPEQRSKLFQPFTQADISTTRKFGGTGLGLALVKRLSQLLGGDFELQESEPGKGSTFFVWIRVQPSLKSKLVSTNDLRFSHPIAPEILRPAEALRGMKVLVVEDSIDNQALMRILLSRTGAEVTIASDGEEGVQKARQEDFDAVLMDVQMPRMDGYEATRTLRSKGLKTPIIALTAHAMKEERAKAEASGVSGFLTKPVDREALIETLQKYRH